MATQAAAATPDSGGGFVAEIADFMFATKSLDKISKGQGSWGDLVNVGVTAATFVVLPAKIALLPAKALNAVIKASSKVVASDVASVAAKRAASRTLDDALTMKRQGYIPEKPTQRFGGEFDQPVERVGRAGMGEPTPAYEVGESILKREGGEFSFPTKAAVAEKGSPGKKYTRPMDEDIDPFNRDRDLLQEADDAIAMSGPKRKNQRLTKEEFEAQSKLKSIQSSQYYDKRKFDDDEIKKRISSLTYEEKKMLKGKSPEEVEDYVRGADYEYVEVYKTTEKVSVEDFVRGAKDKEITEVILRKIRSGEYTDAELETAFKALPKVTASLKKSEDEVVSIFTNIRTILAMDKKDPGLLGKNQKEILEDQLLKLKPEYSKIQARRKKGERVSKQVEEEMPAEIEKVKPEAKLILKDTVEDAKGGVYDSSEKLLIDEIPEAVTDIPGSLKPGTGTSYTKKVPDPEVVAIKVPLRAKMDNDLREGLSMPAQKFAELQAEIRKLESFNKANTRKRKGASEDVLQNLKTESSKNLDLIEKYQKQLLTLKKAIPEEEFVKAVNVSEEITRRALERLRYPFTSSGLSTDRYARPTKTYISGVPKIGKAKPGKGGDSAKYREQNELEEKIAMMQDDVLNTYYTKDPSIPHTADELKEIKAADDEIKILEDKLKALKTKPINSFRGENSFLSNMSDSPVKLGGVEYPTVEHAFQAAKTIDPAERAKILAAKTAGEAKRIGKTVTLRKNWNQMREEVMEKALRAKFEQNPELKKKLLDTGDVDLIEGNTWGDTFWGEVNGKGQNKLGKLLMKIRDELMKGK